MTPTLEPLQNKKSLKTLENKKKKKRTLENNAILGSTYIYSLIVWWCLLSSPLMDANYAEKVVLTSVQQRHLESRREQEHSAK